MKKGLFVGINNYPNCPLRGCLNDVKYISQLAKTYGVEDQTYLLDSNATYQNIITELAKLVGSSKEGDVLFFHYSGHGAQAPTVNRKFEVDGLDECLVPYDYEQRGLLRDDDLYYVFSKLSPGSKLVFLNDSCHSDHGARDFDFLCNNSTSGFASKPSLPRTIGLVSGKASDNVYPLSDMVREININVDMGDVILISGCQSFQTSADAFIGGEYQGALSYVVRSVLEKTPALSYVELVDVVNKSMDILGYDQNPVLECKDEYKDGKFLE